jgi:hypothetical protein
MRGVTWRLTGIIGMGCATLWLLPAAQSQAQQSSPSTAPRSRSAVTRRAPVTPATVAVAPTLTPAAPTQPLNMLEQPPGEAQVAFAGDQLAIHADNSSLAAILRQVAADSGMKITGLSSDERVFGRFGPGAPRDVLAELLNGTAYNLVLIGDSSKGAPRELILTPLARAGTPAPAAMAASQTVPDETANEPDNPDGPPPPPEVPPPASAVPQGVRTPQQLFEQLQQMRQAQQQQIPESQTAPR